VIRNLFSNFDSTTEINNLPLISTRATIGLLIIPTFLTLNPLNAELNPIFHFLVLLGDLTYATHSTLKPVPTLPRQRQIAVTV
jgi:hypothetical protein